MTLDSFKALFRDRPAKRLGPAWHMWQIFLACVPALTVAVVCSRAEKKRLKVMETKNEEVSIYPHAHV